MLNCQIKELLSENPEKKNTGAAREKMIETKPYYDE